MRIVVAKRIGRRGEGLGNEMLSWGKGWIASQILGARLVGPSWGLNKRRYDRNFATSRLDFLWEDALLRVPHYAFSEQDYRNAGEADFGPAFERWVKANGLDRKLPLIVSVDGMYGGYAAIRNARSFLLSKLLSSRGALSNAYEISSKLDRNKLFVAVHMRIGSDFHRLKDGESPSGKFNIAIPNGWYQWVCEALSRQFGERVEFHFFTDRAGPEYDEAVRRFNPGQARQQGMTECSDLLLMTQADLRVCSISSYSLAACFLSGGPYLWYEPQLTLMNGLYTMWGYQAHEKPADSLSSKSMEFFRGHASKNEESAFNFLGTAMNTGDPLPDELIRLLEERLRTCDRRTNLIEYGCLPAREKQDPLVIQ